MKPNVIPFLLGALLTANLALAEKKPCPPLSVKLGFAFDKGTVSAQGLPAEKEMVWQYQLDGGEWMSKMWEKPIPSGEHVILARFMTPGYETGTTSKSFYLPGPPPAVTTPLPPTVPMEARGSAPKMFGTVAPNAGRVVNHPQTSRRLKSIPQLAVSENTSGHPAWERFPVFGMPKGTFMIFDQSCYYKMPEILSLLDHGWTHINTFNFRAHADRQGTKGPKDHPGTDIPYNRRYSIMMGNTVRQGSAVAHKWEADGQIPAEGERKQMENSLVGGMDDRAYWSDGKASQYCAIDVESGPAKGVDSNTWEGQFSARWLRPAKAQRGTRFPADHILQVCCREMHPSWMWDQDTADIAGYLKFNFFSGRQNSDSWDWKVDDQGKRFEKIWQEYGTWADFITLNTEHGLKQLRTGHQGPLPKVAGVSFITAHYDEMIAVTSVPDKKWCDLRPDIAENLPIWNMFAGARGMVLWGTVSSTNFRAEEGMAKGAWRLAQIPQILEGAPEAIIPEVSADGGKTWIKMKSGFESGGAGMSLGHKTALNDYFNGKVPWEKVVPPFEERVRTRGLVNKGLISIVACDPWQANPAVTRDILIRYGKFVDSVRLYGRETYLGVASL